MSDFLTMAEFEKAWEPHLMRAVRETEGIRYVHSSDSELRKRVREVFDIELMWDRYVTGKSGEPPA